MGAPFKVKTDVKWITDKDGIVVGFQDERNQFVGIPRFDETGSLVNPTGNTVLNIVLVASGDTSGAVDSAALAASIAALNAAGRGSISFGVGRYYVKGSLLPELTVPCTIQGQGHGAIERMGTTGSMINVDLTAVVNVENNTSVFVVNSSGVHIRNMSLRYDGTSAPTYPAINVGGVGSAGIVHKNGTRCEYRNLEVINFSIGIDVWGTAYTHISQNFISGNAWIGIRIANIYNNDSNDIFVHNNVITSPSWSTAGMAAIYWMSGGGLICSGNKINQNCNPGNGTGIARYFYGIRVKQMNVGCHGPDGVVWNAPNAGATSDIKITGNSIENVLGCPVLVEQSQSGVGPANISITDNQGLLTGSNVAVNMGLVTGQSGLGSGYTVGDILTIPGGTGTATTFSVTDTNASGAIMDWQPVQLGSFSVLPSSLGLTRAVPTGGTGSAGGAFFYQAPIYHIAVLGFTQISSCQINGNVGADYAGGIIAGGIASGSIANNTWRGPISSSVQIPGVFLDRYGVAPYIGATVEPSNFVGTYNVPNSFNSWLYASNNASDADGISGAWKGLVKHKYRHAIAVVNNNVQVALFTIEVARYSGAMIDLTFQGTLNASGTPVSWMARLQRAVSAEASGSTAVVSVTGTDFAMIGGVSKTVTVASNIAKISSGATDEIDIGFVPQGSNRKIYVYVIAPTGASGITTISGDLTISIDGVIQKVGIGNF